MPAYRGPLMVLHVTCHAPTSGPPLPYCARCHGGYTTTTTRQPSFSLSLSLLHLPSLGSVRLPCAIAHCALRPLPWPSCHLPSLSIRIGPSQYPTLPLPLTAAAIVALSPPPPRSPYPPQHSTAPRTISPVPPCSPTFKCRASFHRRPAARSTERSPVRRCPTATRRTGKRRRPRGASSALLTLAAG